MTISALRRIVVAACGLGLFSSMVVSCGSSDDGPSSAAIIEGELRQLATEAVEVEQRYVECMALEGFRDLPPPSAEEAGGIVVDDGHVLDGYGLATSLVGLMDEEVDAPELDVLDEEPPSAEHEARIEAEAGCAEQVGLHEVGPAGEALDTLTTEARVRALADQRIVDAERAWSECMRGEGYEFERVHEPPLAVEQGVNARLDELGIGAAVASSGFVPDGQQAVPEPPPEMLAAESLDELAEIERQIAASDEACRAISAYDDTFEVVYDDAIRTVYQASGSSEADG